MDLKPGWKRLVGGELLKCTCGTVWGRVGHGTVTWFGPHSPAAAALRPNHDYECQRKFCRRKWIGITFNVDAPGAQQPPSVAA